MKTNQPKYDSQAELDMSLRGLGLIGEVPSPNTYNDFVVPLSNALQSLRADWGKPRYALPSLDYLNPLRTLFATAYAVMVFSVLAMASVQLGYAYFSGNGLDVTPAGFVPPMAMFLVAAVGAASELRRLVLRHALRRQARQQIVDVEYKINLTPAEAGIMLDAYSDNNEAAGMLSKLRADGHLAAVQGFGVQIVHFNGNRQGLRPDEAAFVNFLFGSSNDLAMYEFERGVPVAAKRLRKATFESMALNGDLPLLSPAGKIMYFILRAFTIVGFVVGALIFATLFDPSAYRINYPRYGVELWQLSFIWMLLAILVVIPLQAYFTKVFSQEGMNKYCEAAGLYMYIETVLVGRFGNGELAESEEAYYLPYAQAFGLEPANFDISR